MVNRAITSEAKSGKIVPHKPGRLNLARRALNLSKKHWQSRPFQREKPNIVSEPKANEPREITNQKCLDLSDRGLLSLIGKMEELDVPVAQAGIDLSQAGGPYREKNDLSEYDMSVLRAKAQVLGHLMRSNDLSAELFESVTYDLCSEDPKLRQDAANLLGALLLDENLSDMKTRVAALTTLVAYSKISEEARKILNSMSYSDKTIAEIEDEISTKPRPLHVAIGAVCAGIGIVAAHALISAGNTGLALVVLGYSIVGAFNFVYNKAIVKSSRILIGRIMRGKPKFEYRRLAEIDDFKSLELKPSLEVPMIAEKSAIPDQD